MQPGTKILNGRYEILKVIHTSGMSNVYLATDSQLNKQWCLKEIRKSEAGKDLIEYQSLMQETKIMKSLNHASIPRITSIENWKDSVIIVMDYVDGISVKSFLLKKGRVEQDVVVAWMKQVTNVMMYLHNRKEPIFYRDMKPDNIMIQSDGNIKLLDFGISIVIKSKNQKIGKALGTRGYAAPEQCKSDNVCDLRSDIYAMGMTMYYMLTGLNPSQIPKDRLRPVREVNSSVSIGLEQIVHKCTRDNPNERYQSCEELMYALQNYANLDSNHRKKLRHKCNTVVVLALSAVFCFGMSFVPYNLNKSQKDEQYSRLKVVAEQSGKATDYEAVLDVDPLDIGTYLGYIDSLKVDGAFTKDEESNLLKYVNTNLEALKLEDNYGELAYEIGKLYWFYYDSSTTEDEGILTSVKWFEDARDNGYKEDLADVYYQLGNFKRSITASVTESSDSGMYKDYWDNLIKAKDIDNGELVTLQLNTSIASCISTYTYNLKQDGISYDDIESEIKDLQDYINSYTPSLDKARVTYESLKTTVSTLEDKVSTIYKGGTE